MTRVNRFTPTNYLFTGGIALSLLVGFTLLKSSFATVNPGERGVVVQLGKVQKTILGEGTYPVIPFITSVKKINVRI